ncbi:MAG: 50S ribosomal protein L21 [Anaerolineae bacterium]|nr:50S ribosomal protein L21 [Anaerolineae bacterium]
MYAVVKSGARQYRASAGSTLVVERLPGEVGQQVELRDVLLVAGAGETKIGRPTVAGAKVVATIVAQEKGPKIRIFKYRPKERYRRRAGHRQYYTRLRVDRIVV